MGFEGLRFFNFRNLKDAELPLGAREIFLVGENGQGKTNLLEAVHLLCLGSSFREKRESAFVREPSSPTGLFGRYGGGDGSVSLSLRMAPGRRKEMRLNDKLLTERRDLLAEVLCICFVQQDMDFVAGPPEERRRRPCAGIARSSGPATPVSAKTATTFSMSMTHNSRGSGCSSRQDVRSSCGTSTPCSPPCARR